jgi:HSP20 family molecular chaperone IbpA
MNYNTALSTECFIYPGAYALLPETKTRLGELKSEIIESADRLPVNINEFPDCYRFEAGIPFASREEIMLDIKDGILSIIILRRTSSPGDVRKNVLQMHEFTDAPIERHIELPENANAEFISAEFSNGILRIDIPIDNNKPSANSGQIVIY